MKKIFTMALISLVLLSAATARGHRSHSFCVGHDFSDGSRSLRLDDGTLVIRSQEEPWKVEITERYKLYVDGDPVLLDDEQQELVEEYYDLAIELVDEATRIGLEGARIGVSGAKVGVQAVTGVLRVLLTDYTSDDLERDIEREAAKIEAKASRLEIKANKLEDLAKDLERKYEEMEDEIPALRGDI